MKKGELIEVEIENYAFEGKGIARINQPENDEKKFVVFVNGAYPGDVVSAKLIKVKKSYAEAVVEKIITPSQSRVEKRCKYFGICGGCKQQNLDYQIQLRYKEEQVKDIFDRLGGFNNYKIEPIIPSENIFFYRNKMEFSFAEKRWLTVEEISSKENIADQNFALGLHIPGLYDKVLDIDECFLQSEVSNKILNFTRDFFKNKNTTIYSTQTHAGYLRNLVIKHSTKNELMVNLVTSEDDEKLFKNYSEKLIENIPSITTIVNNINIKKAQVAAGDFEKVYFGNGYIFDSISNFNFRISANSFFQTNTNQAEKLYSKACEFADLKGKEIVYDLYSGAGTIAIYISKFAKKVFAFETVDAALKDAEVNLELNNISNVEFFQADLNKTFLPILTEKEIPKPDVIIADPPRSGMHPKTVEDIIKISPEKIVYISCNPTTQARDIKQFVASGFLLVKIQPVDMFPHTFHIENISLLHKA